MSPGEVAHELGERLHPFERHGVIETRAHATDRVMARQILQPRGGGLGQEPLVPLIVGLLLILAAGALTVDLPLARWAAGRSYPRTLRELLSLAEVLGHGVGVAVVAIIILALDGRRRAALRLVLVSAWAGLGANLVKLVVSRSRPAAFDLTHADVWTSFGGWWPLGHGGSTQQSFPSAHTATVVGMSLVLASLLLA